ncbi:hypothetical protein ABZY58_12105 [Micromonospora tulbaghiae]|uniref:hypothetical protein n=1 Tax=Micromonospora tulbaghiae TaxID=479978 RepID=UPI0033B8EDD5
MPVALLPPFTRSMARDLTAVPLNSGPRYVRGPASSRWHRVRAGVQRTDRTTWDLWCGPFMQQRDDRPIRTADHLDPGEQVCGTCVGRALGAGQDDVPAGMPGLVFSPRWLNPPKLCPGSGSEQLIGPRPESSHRSVGVCLACGDLVGVRCMGRRYDTRVGLTSHEPGAGLLPACPFHSWQYVVLRPSGRAGCTCGWHDELTGRAR